MNRRDFLKSSSAAAVFASLALVGISCGDSGTEPDNKVKLPNGVTVDGNKVTVDLTIQTSLKSSGKFLLIEKEHVFLINLDGNNFKAFTSICTHQGCDVNDFSGNKIICPCHGSKYSTSGSVVDGPAPSGLKEYAVSKPTADSLQITKA